MFYRFDKYTYSQIEKRDKAIAKEVKNHVAIMVADAVLQENVKRQERAQTRAQALIDVRRRMEEALERIRRPPQAPAINQPVNPLFQPIPLTQNQINQQLTLTRQQFEGQIAKLQPLTAAQISAEIAQSEIETTKHAEEWARKLLPHKQPLSNSLQNGGMSRDIFHQ